MRKLTTVLGALTLFSLIFSAVDTASIQSEWVYRIDSKVVSRFDARPSWAGPKNGEEGPTVEIVYPADGDNLLVGTYAIDVKATGEEIMVEVTIANTTGEESILITNTKSGDYYVLYPWIVTEGEYSITAKATDKNGDTTTSTITGSIDESAPAAEYELVIEIDYMEGHEPTQSVMDYIKDYYIASKISVSFTISDKVPYDSSITDSEFWALEAKYNDGNDNAHDGLDVDGVDGDYEYTLKEKWVLFGTVVEGSASTIGYCYIKIENKDLVAGNYIFIAGNQVDNMGEEATVLMHELGHSIGIAKVNVRGRHIREIYDEDPFSVMSYMSTDNAGLMDAWHYSNQYWDTKDIDYYLKP